MEVFNLQDVFKIQQSSLAKEIPLDYTLGCLNILMIHSGSGVLKRNSEHINYLRRSVFLLPEKCSCFLKPQEETNFYFLNFKKEILSSKVAMAERSIWLRMIDHLAGHPNLLKKDALGDEEDRIFAWQLLEQIVKENKRKNEYSNQVTVSLVSILLSLIGRNLNEKQHVSPLIASGKNSKYVEGIKAYIKTNLHDTGKLRLNAIASYFNTTKSTLSIKFKKETKQSLHNYIITKRLNSAKDKLIQTDFTVSQIAYQLGFTDESHLTRMFKKYEKCTPKAYKLKHTNGNVS